MTDRKEISAPGVGTLGQSVILSNMTTTTKPARTTRLIENGHSVHADEGAVNQDGLLPIYVCNTCSDQVVWATSNRTGRKYLVSVTTKRNGARFYMKHNIHPMDCGARRDAELAQVAAFAAKNEAARLAALPTVDKIERRYLRTLELLAARQNISGAHRWALVTHFVTEAMEELDEVAG